MLPMYVEVCQMELEREIEIERGRETDELKDMERK